MIHAIEDMTNIRVERENLSIRERFQNSDNLFIKKPSINIEFEEFKRIYSEEIKAIKQELIDVKTTYEREKEEWQAKREEIEQELNMIEYQPSYKATAPHTITYDRKPDWK